MTDLKKVPTEELVQELIGRDGIQTYSGGLYRKFAITTKYGQAMPVLPPYYRVIMIREENHSEVNASPTARDNRKEHTA